MMKKKNISARGIEEEDSQLKSPGRLFNKVIEENFPNLREETSMNVYEIYRTRNMLD